MIKIGSIEISNNKPFVLMAGPCVIESEEHCLKMAKKIKDICEELSIPFIFKTSFDKANRTSINSYRGPGLEEGIEILKKIKEKIRIPVTSDIHETYQIKEASNVLDIIQIPAFLCRQTDLIAKSAMTDKPINIKKGQFMAPKDMKKIMEKATKFENKKVMITERGSSFGYNNLIVDMRSLEMMKEFCDHIIFDSTHSVQLPGALTETSGGERKFIEPLTKSAIVLGIAGIFLEVHDKPEKALCDKECQFNLDSLKDFLIRIKKIDNMVKNKEKNALEK